MIRRAIWIFIFFPIFFQNSKWDHLHSKDIPVRLNFNPQPQEGYFQGWNFYFQNQDTVIFITFLVSNLGPGSLNNGISLFLKSPEIGEYYRTKEYANFDLESTSGKFGQKSGQNRMYRKGDHYHIDLVLEDMNLSIEWSAKNKKPYSLSGGNHSLKGKNRFLRADIGFSQSPSSVHITYKGKQFHWKGMGGMEHLNTNLEVHKFSKRWEILRVGSSNRDSLYFGGFDSSNEEENFSFKKIAILSKTNETMLEDEVDSIRVVKKRLDTISGYYIPETQEISLKNNKDCKVEIQDRHKLGVINVLSNISSVLKFFIRLFFAKPYQIHYAVEVDVKCKEWHKKFNQGIHSYYLINPD